MQTHRQTHRQREKERARAVDRGWGEREEGDVSKRETGEGEEEEDESSLNTSAKGKMLQQGKNYCVHLECGRPRARITVELHFRPNIWCTVGYLARYLALLCHC